MSTFDHPPDPDQLRAAEQQAIQLFTASRAPQKITYGNDQSYIPAGFSAHPITAEDMERATSDPQEAARLKVVMGEYQLSQQLPDSPRIIITQDNQGNIRLWDVKQQTPQKLEFISTRRDGIQTRKGAVGGNYRNKGEIYLQNGSMINIPATRKGSTNVEADVLFSTDLMQQGKQKLWVLFPQQKQVEKIVQPQPETTAGVYPPGSWQVRKGLYEKEYLIAGRRSIVLSEEGDATKLGRDSRHFAVNGQPVNEDRVEVLEKGTNREVNEVDVIMADGATDAGDGTGWHTATAAVSNYIEARKRNSSFENAVSASAEGAVQRRKDLFSDGYKYGAAAVTCIHAARNRDGSWNVDSANQGANRVLVLVNGQLHDLEKESNILTQALVGQVLFKGSEDQQTEIQLLDSIKVPQHSVIVTYTDGNLEQDYQREVPYHIAQIAQMVAQKKTSGEIRDFLKRFPKGKDDRTISAVLLD